MGGSDCEAHAALDPLLSFFLDGRRLRVLPHGDTGRALADRLRCADCHGPALQGTNAGAARLSGQKARYTVWSLQQMRGGNRSHGTAAKPDPLLADLSNAEIESLAAHLASLR